MQCTKSASNSNSSFPSLLSLSLFLYLYLYLSKTTKMPSHHRSLLLISLIILLSQTISLSFESDELLLDLPDEELVRSVSTQSSSPRSEPVIKRKSLDPDSDSKLVFQLDHAFGVDSEFESAGAFTARLKTWSHGGQSLTKLRFSREDFTEEDKNKFKKLLKDDDFYRIRVPSNVLSPTGRDYIISSVKARCLPRDRLDEHFVINMEGANILAVNYGSPGACPYPRQEKLPAKWTFNSHTILKTSEQAPRTPSFAEEILLGGGENAEGEAVKLPEKSFWAKYWMYAIPLALMVMNAVTQVMNMPEEQQGRAAAAQGQPIPAAGPRGQTAAVRRR